MIHRLKIISGGQTGVDRAALEWALENEVFHGGWCPKGRRAEDGIIPKQFQLAETDSPDYVTRTRLNVRDSDATVIFAEEAELNGGTKATSEIASDLGKPILVLVVSPAIGVAAAKLNSFLKEHTVSVLNVAGPRASDAPKIGAFVKAVLSLALNPSSP